MRVREDGNAGMNACEKFHNAICNKNKNESNLREGYPVHAFCRMLLIRGQMIRVASTTVISDYLIGLLSLYAKHYSKEFGADDGCGVEAIEIEMEMMDEMKLAREGPSLARKNLPLSQRYNLQYGPERVLLKQTRHTKEKQKKNE